MHSRKSQRADKSDTRYLQQQAAGRLAKTILDTNPTHPGAHHYLIHAYDLPTLAEKAIDIADNYGKMAPKVPHAAHMLSHIYTRLGAWQKSIHWNKISSSVAWEMCVDNDEINHHFTHAQDYLIYAYLQMGDEQAAKAVVDKMHALAPPYTKTNHASALCFCSNSRQICCRAARLASSNKA